MSKGKFKDVNNKLRVFVSTSKLIGHNYINKSCGKKCISVYTR